MALEPPHLGEFGRIERYFRPLTVGFPGARRLLDDAATVDVPAGRQLVVTTDAVVAGVHFLPSDDPADVARKALRVNLSDLAAKGAAPLCYTLTLALTSAEGDGWVERFVGALSEDQATYGIALAGGDSVSTSGPVWVSITAMGTVESDRMVTRSGGKAGDVLLVSGTIGDAGLGLAVAEGRYRPEEEDAAFLLARYRRPEPRTAIGPALARNAHAALDISDGLVADCRHLCRASNLSARIDADRVPLSAAGRRHCLSGGNLADLLTAGDDYEILFAIAPELLTEMVTACVAACVPVSPIGCLEHGPAEVRILGPDGAPLALRRPGWTHF